MPKYILDNGVKREMTTAEETEGVLSGDALVAVNLSSLRSMRNLCEPHGWNIFLLI